MVRRATQAVLRRAYDVFAVDGVPAALELLDAGDRFDVIVSDMRMHPENGMDFHATLSARFTDQAARVIFVTGSASEPPVARFFASIPNRCLRKPVEPRALLDAIAAVLDEHRGAIETEAVASNARRIAPGRSH